MRFICITSKKSLLLCFSFYFATKQIITKAQSDTSTPLNNQTSPYHPKLLVGTLKSIICNLL